MHKKNFILLLALFTFLITAPPAFAGPAVITLPNPLCSDPAGEPGDCTGTSWQGAYSSQQACYEAYGYSCVSSIPALIEKVTFFIAGIVGVLATLMFVIAGIMFVTSGGSAEKINTARKTATYAGVGLVIALVGAGLAAVISSAIGV